MAKILQMKGFVDKSDEEKYIALDRKIKTLEVKRDNMKKKFRKQFDKGLKFRLLTVIEDHMQFAPKWKDVAYTLAKVLYRSKKDFLAWELQLHEQYPETPVAASFKVPEGSDGATKRTGH